MRFPAVARLVAGSAVAVGAVALSLHLAQATRATPAAATTPTTTAVATTTTAAPSHADPRHALQAVLRVPDAPAGPRPTTGGLSGGLVVPETVEESRPHSHVVDPRTGGLVSVAGAVGAVAKVRDLGPIHEDPLPVGVRLSDPTDTASLLERAGDVQAALAASDEPVAVGATAPIGTPGVASLSAHVAPSCTGTGTDGHRVQVLYVHDAATPSRYTQVLPVLRNEVADVDDVFAVSSAQTGGGRRVRWVHDASCLPVVKDVTVPTGALGSDFWATVKALKALGYADPSRKYLVFADADQLCGIGTLYDDRSLTGNDNDGVAASYARIDANCWSTGHSVAAHELTHTLGGVQQGAPHATVKGHCWDESDIMCYDDGSGVAMQQLCPSAQEQLLDCNHDDYFNTAPPAGSFLAKNWNTASSSFLDTVPALAATLPVTVQASTRSATTGQAVTFTATTPHAVTWQWSTGSGCSLRPTTPGAATMLCPSTVTGAVTATATGTDTTSGAVGGGSASVSVSRAAAPTVAVSAPATAAAGVAFPVTASPTGTAPFGYAWTAGPCAVAAPTAASTTVTCPSDGAAQNVVVAVTLTQADGQVAQGSAAVAVAAADGTPPPADPTTWTVPRVSQGSLRATLRTGTGTGTGAVVAGAPAVLQVRWYGASDWVDLTDTVTDATGTAVTGATYPRAGSFRFTFTGDADRAGSASPATYLKVGTRVAARVGRHVVDGTLRTVTGAHVAGARLTLERRAVGSRHWVRVAQVRTNAYGVVVRRVRPAHRSYFRWVFPGEQVHRPALSPRLTVRR